MKALLYLFIQIFTHITFASESNSSPYEEPLQIISQINNGTLLEKPSLGCIAVLHSKKKFSQKSNSPNFNKCATDLCGAAKKNKSIWMNDSNFSSNLPWWIMRKVEKQNPLLDKIIDITLKKKNNELEKIKNYINDAPALLSRLSQKDKEDFEFFFFSPYIKEIVHPGEELHKRVKIQITPPKNASKEMIEALDNYAANLQASILYSPTPYRNLNIFTDTEISTLTKEAYSKIKEDYEKNKHNLSWKIKEELISSGKSLEQATLPFQYEILLRTLVEIDIKIAQVTKKFVLTRPTCEIPSCENIYQDYFNNPGLKKNMELYEKTLLNPSTKTNAINTCKASMIRRTIKAAEMEEAKIVFNEAKNAVISNVLPIFSKHSRKIMMNYLNYSLTMSNKNPSQLGKKTDSIDVFSAAAKEYIIKNAAPQTDIEDIAIWNKISVLQKSFDEIGPLDERNPCENSIFPVLAWDSYLPMQLIKGSAIGDLKKQLSKLGDDDHLFVSEFSCQNADHGKHNVAHEISHALNYLFLTSKLSEESIKHFGKIRECVISHYPNARPIYGATSHPGDKIYSEEDTADLFAFLSNPRDRKIYSCVFLESNLTNDSYANLDFINEKNTTHPTGFSRVLFEAINKDIPLPDSCRELIEEEKPDMRFNKCIM